MQGRLRRFLGDFYYQRCHPIVASLRRMTSARPARSWRIYWERRKTEHLLAEISVGGPVRISGHVLIDGLWDNPHYWLRYSLIRSALGLARAKEVGVVGVNRTRQCRATFRRLNVGTVVNFTEFFPPADEVRGAVRRILDTLREPADILECKLPFDFPATFLYDGILKRQRKPSVDLRHGRLDLAQRIRDDMRDESPARIRAIRDEILSIRERKFWEITDRGHNFDYVDEETRPHIRDFFAPLLGD